MINGRNLQDLLHQVSSAVTTTEKSIVAAGITLPNGNLLSSYTDGKISIIKLRIFSLFAQKQLKESGNTLKKYEVQDENITYNIFLQLIPNTEYGVLILTELDYPDGLISLKVKSLLENLSELEQFEFIED